MDAHWDLGILSCDVELGTVIPAAEPPPDTPESSRRIGKYVILGPLGKGAMGAVYKAFDPTLEREVAVKVMLPRIAQDPEQKQRFEREARAVARMAHPNVVTLFDLGYHIDGSPYLVMELLKGEDLLQTLRSRRLSLEQKLAIGVQILDGLDHAHRAGIVHRDIKPANVFIGEHCATKIMDFGVAHLEAAAMTAAGVVVGTANYMSPEQVLGQRVDGRSDIFSVGCLLCEMLSGHPPFEADSMMSILYRVTQEEPSLTLPEGQEYQVLVPVLRRALDKSAEARFATAHEFAEALRSLGRTPDAVRVPPAAARPAPRGPERSTRGVEGSPAGRSQATLVAGAAAVPAAGRPPDPAGICRLLREIHVGGRSGQLHFAHCGERRNLRLIRGRIVHAASDVDGERLGDVLVRFGHLSQADLERAVPVVLARRQRLGAVLEQLGLLDRERLAQAVAAHVREILFSVLERPDGSFTFEDLPESTPEEALSCALTTAEVILEATRRIQDPALIESALGDMGRVLVPAADPRLRAQAVTLTPTDGFILSRIDGTISARDLLALVPMASADAARSLFGLLCTGLVDYRAAAPGARTAPRRSRAGAHEAISAPSPEPARAPGPGVQAAKSAPASATAAASRAAPSPSPAPPPIAPAPAAPDGEAAKAAAPADLRSAILDAHEGLRYRDHFEILGVARAASETEVKQAYVRLVRTFHPDACNDPSLADVGGKRNAVLARAREAYDTLRDPAARAAYERNVAPLKYRPSLPRNPTPPPAEAPPAVPPAARDQRADVAGRAAALISQAKYWDAIQLLEPAIVGLQGGPRSRARVLLAQAYMKNPKWLRRAEAVLQDVVREDPAQAEAYLLLGQLYRESGLEARAAAAFRKVLDLRPGQPQAAAELESLEASRRRGLSAKA